MKKLILLTLVLWCTVSSFSQNKNFDLSKYKLPDIKRHQLDLSFNLGGGQNNYTENDEVDIRNKHFNSEAFFDYNFYFNSRKKIINSTTSLSPSFLYKKEKEGSTIEDTNRESEIHFNTKCESSFFQNEKNLFLHIAPELILVHSKEKSKRNSETNFDYTYNSFEASVGLGIGKGRLEPVSDLWQSYFILESLNKDGLLNRELNESDIEEFATLSSQLKNKRFFDYRLRKIEEMKALDSLLHNQQLITNTNINYFTILNDYWSFANVSDRYSGSEIKFISTPRFYSWSNKNSNSQNDRDESFFDITSKISFKNSKQINLFWERNLWCEVSSRNILDREEDTANDFLSGSIGFEYNYFPNFRTSIQSGLSVTARESNVYSNGDLLKKWINETYLHSSINYYISPQLRLSGTIGLSYINKLNYRLTDILNIGYQLNLAYAIF